MIDLFPPDRSTPSSPTPAAAARTCGTTGALLEDDPAMPARGAGVGPQGAGRARVAGRDRLAGARGRAVDGAGHADVPRFVSPDARAEASRRSRAASAAVAARRVARRAEGVDLVLRQRRRLRGHAAGAGRCAARTQGRPRSRHRGASMVATGNPGCHLQIERGLATGASAVSVVHPDLAARGGLPPRIHRVRDFASRSSNCARASAESRWPPRRRARATSPWHLRSASP